MENDTLFEKNGIVPVLLSLFVGFVVVLLISGLVVNYVGKSKEKNVQTADKVEETVEVEKVSILDRIKGIFPFGKKNKGEVVVNISPTVTPNPNVPTIEVEGLDGKTMTEFFNMVTASGMTDITASKGKGSVTTLIIPHNEAFAQSSEAIQILVDRGNTSEIQSLVQRHMIHGRVSNGPVQTVSGEEVYIDFNLNTVTFDGITANIVQKSGDTIVVDRVLY